MAMYINHVFYQTRFSDQLKKHPISDRVKTYLSDLYERYHSQSIIDFSQPVYNHAEAGDQLFCEASRHIDFGSLSMILFPIWETNLNMEYAVPELYWKNKYAIEAQFQDVRDCGSLCVFYAIQLLLKLSAAQCVKNSLCCSIENSIQTNKKITNVILPEIDYSAFIAFSNTVDSGCTLKILSSDIFHTAEINSTQLFHNMIKNKLNNLFVQLDDIIIYKRKSDEDHRHDACIEMIYPMTSGFVYFCLENIIKNKKNIQCSTIFIIDYDASQETMGVLLLEIKSGVEK
jgi:hypothetical protein